ncbi:ArgE/DapE family deacylase, partial [candidate division KSB1 bacterium]|nr:ArgE/DapE family deacylase [candidate division KSB1 bacterium]
MKIDKDFTATVLVKLVQINSINPVLVKDAPGESEIGSYIAGVLRSSGVETQINEIEPGRVNVTGVVKGSGTGKSLMLNAHMDTVGVDGMSDPFSGKISNGKVYGRGSQDMKGSIAAMLAAVKYITENNVKLNGDLIATFVADEEYGSIGSEQIAKQIKADAAIVTEPTDLQVCLAHKGFYLFEIQTKGRAAHGSRFEEGVDANLHMGRILKELDSLSKNIKINKDHPLVGPPSLHVPLIKGGTQEFIYADNCIIKVERRSIPGEKHEDIVREIAGVVENASASDPDFNAYFKTEIYRNAYEIAPEAPIAETVANAASKVTGKPPQFTGHTAWMDSALFAEAGIETVIIGPTGAGLHSSEEWVDIQSVVDLAEILVVAAV